MNNIIYKNKTPYTYTLPSLYYADTINPINKTVVEKNIIISSKFRSNYYNSLSSDFIYELPMHIDNVVSLKVTNIQLPPILYNISSYLGNNFFIIKNQTTSETKKIIIPDSVYSNESLISYLNYLFNNFDDEFKYIYFASIDNGETIIGLKNTAPYIFNFILEFDNDFIENVFSSLNKTDISETTSTGLSSKLGWILGFRYDCYQNKSIYVSEGLINTSTSSIFLCIDDYNENQFNNNYMVFNNNTLLSNNIVSEIYFNYNNISNMKINSIKKTYFSPINLRKLNIKLIDQYGKIVNLNNDDFNFTLTLETKYK